MIKQLYLILLALLPFPCFSQASNSDTTHLKTLLTTSLYYYKTNDTLNGHLYFTKALNAAEKTSNWPLQTRLCTEAVPYLLKDARLINVFRTHLLRTERLDPFGTDSLAIHFIDDIYNQVRNTVDDSLETNAWADVERLCLQAIAIAPDGLRGYCNLMPYESLGQLWYDQGDMNKALYYCLSGVHLAETHRFSRYAQQVYQMAARVFVEMHDSVSASGYLQKAYALTREQLSYTHRSTLDMTTLATFSRAFIQLNKPLDAFRILQENSSVVKDDSSSAVCYTEQLGECYFALKDYNKAEGFYLQALAQDKDGSHRTRLITENRIGILYVATHQYNKALPYLTDLVSAENIRIIPKYILKDIWYRRFQTDSALGNYVAAIDHLQLAHALSDSIFAASKKRLIQDVETQSALHQTRLLLRAFMAGATLLTLLLALLYNRYRIKLKNSRRQQQLIAEKEWLVQEINHRVKNNLQIIVSLLRTQAHYLKDAYAISAFNDIGQRVQAISLIHQMLYQEEGLSLVNLPDYVHELVNYLTEGPGTNPIHFDLRIDNISLNMAQSVPVGLILNEAITNALKYAFPEADATTEPTFPPTTVAETSAPEPDAAAPIITITIRKLPDQRLLLTIADNGRGLATNIDPQSLSSMGLLLMTTLTDQLEGTISFHNDEGLFISIEFPFDSSSLTRH